MIKSIKFELLLNYLMLSLLIGGMTIITGRVLSFAWSAEHYFEIATLSFVELFAFFLFYTAMVHLLARQGYFKRINSHNPACNNSIEKFLVEKDLPSLVILLPSYKEEIPVIAQSLYSAALQTYPNRQIVLLIDNPPDCPLLNETKNLVNEINQLLQNQHHTLLEKIDSFQKRAKQDVEFEITTLAAIYEEMISWFNAQAENYPLRDHTDKTFVDLTFIKRALHFSQKKDQLLNSKDINFALIAQEYALLRHLFQVEITSFERKKYYNFSHAANKSMNLNSYISVLGKYYKESTHQGHLILEECEPKDALHSFSQVDYISILDADSVLTHDYAARLIYEMQQPQFAKTAVIQTPYSAFPKAPGTLEKMAGAQTDIQYILHQGLTHFGATFWVGANALIRKTALDDIVQHKIENNFLISRYVQDRTVIEDTESSIDLAIKGWSLHNFPERLSYSATPPDFGSLLIQRKRWANGGLIILPKALAYLWKGRFSWKVVKECFFRIHYLISIPAFFITYGLMLLSPLSLAEFPLESALLSLPYLAIYSRDLKLTGYRYTDIFRVVALNTLLVPVNLAGVRQSITQITLGKHTPFFRTPKISGLTLIPPLYLLIFLATFSYTFYQALSSRALFDGFMVIILAYGLIKHLRLHDSIHHFLRKKTMDL